MEPALSSERRSPPGLGVPRPPPRGHAPSTAAPSPTPVSSSVQSDEERQPRISESGQFSDGLEDRGELPPPWVPSPPPLGSHLSPVSGGSARRAEKTVSGSLRTGQQRLLGPPFRFQIPAGALSGVRGKTLQTGFLVAYREPTGFLFVLGDVGSNASCPARPASHPGRLLYDGLVEGRQGDSQGLLSLCTYSGPTLPEVLGHSGHCPTA